MCEKRVEICQKYIPDPDDQYEPHGGDNWPAPAPYSGPLIDSQMKALDSLSHALDSMEAAARRLEKRQQARMLEAWLWLVGIALGFGIGVFASAWVRGGF